MGKLLRKNLKILLTLAFVITFLLVGAYILQRYGFEKVIEVIRNQGIKGMIVYIAFLILASVFSPLNSLILKPIVFVIYGYWTSVFLAFLGSSLGGLVNYVIAKRFGRPLIKRVVGVSVLKKIDGFTDVAGWKAFLFLRVVGANYYDYISYAAGLTKMSFRQFAAITFPVNFLWKILVFYMISKAIHFRTPSYISLMVVIYALSIYGGFLIWKKYSKFKSNVSRS